MTEYGTEKPWEADVFKNKIPFKKGLVSRVTSIGAFVYDPKKNETPESAEWFPFESPNGTKTVIFEGK